MKLFSIKKWRLFSVIAASVLAVIIAGACVAFDQAAALNSTFKCKTYEIVSGEKGGEDTTYFKSEFTTYGQNFAERTTDTAALQTYMDNICEEIETEGLVLLKNDNEALPLKKNAKVSLLGQGCANFNYSTSGSSSNTSTASYPTLKESLEKAELSVNPTLWEFYIEGAGKSYKRNKPNFIYKTNEAPWSAYSSVESSLTEYSDAAIFVISRNSGEGMDISTINSDGLDGSYLSITAEEKDVLTNLTNLKKSGKISKLIVLLNSAVPIQLDFMFDATIEIDASMWVGNVGSTGIYAIGNALAGKINPSGRLSDTFVKDNFSSAAAANWALNPNKSFSREYANAKDYPEFDETQNVYGVYAEGIYVGYKYYETRYADVIMSRPNVGEYKYSDDVAYPFGYGLSYTNFQYDNFVLTENEDEIEVKVKVTNLGDYAGKEVVQLYLSKPYTDYDILHGVEKSAVELVGFAKTDILESNGGEETVTITVEKEQLKTYDADGAKTYILDEGKYYFAVCTSSHDALNNILVADGYSVEENSDPSLCDYIEIAEFDDETYSKSVETGNAITNQFDFADMNRYDGAGDNKITYVTRSDWEGSFPKTAYNFTITEKMAEDIRSNKPIIEDGSAMPTMGNGGALSLIMLRGKEYDYDAWSDLLDQLSYADMAYLITNAQHNTVLLESVNKPATRDENGPNGVSGSITKTAFPSEGIWASSFNLELIERAGEALGEDAVAAGITGLYANGVNIHRVPFGGRAHEYFSEDAYLTGIASQVETQGMQSKGVLAYIKHYAVNNEETNRNGVAVWLNEQSLREIYLLPFELSFRPSKGNAHATMTSFNRIGCIWTSGSSELMITLPRDEWAFDGYSITDMAASNAKSFMTYVDGIINGTDCYDGPGSTTALDDYKDSPAFANRMREAAHRILYSIVNFSAVMNGISSQDKIVKIATWWEIVIISLVVVIGVLTVACAVMLSLSYLKKNKK